MRYVDAAEMSDLMELAARYWACADGDASERIEDLFTEDAVLQLGNLVLEGRAAIVKFFADRDAAQRSAQRTTRHVACNHRVAGRQGDRVTVCSTVMVYAGVGAIPLESGAPTGIADFRDDCVKSAQGEWRFAKRAGGSIFVGPGAASFAR